MAAFDISQLNVGQRSVVERLDEPLFVAAGAGSGKTFTLTARLVHALSEGSAADGGRYLSSIDEALVITFTEAAALEIKERVRQALREAGEDDPHLYAEALKVDGAWISTIHGMCARILRRHGIELGLDPGLVVGEGSVVEALEARATEEVMAEVVRDDAYAALRREYPLWSGARGAFSVAGMIAALRSEATKCPHGFDDFVCPSSHETPAALGRVVRALEALCALKLTDRQRAAAEAALAEVAPLELLPLGERTPERACEALLRIKLPDLRKADQKVLKEEAKAALAEALVVAEHERVQVLAGQLVDLARRVDARYGQLKREHGYLDNDDLISYALEAVESSPAVVADYAGRFRLVMIDEFQDTDERQLRLISLLAGKDARHLTTVGDAQQSIYRFRGGDVSVFRARGAGLDPASHVKMDVNYRSDPAVLALVERVCGDAGLLGDFLKLAADGGRRSRYQARAADGTEPPRICLEVAAGGNAELLSATLAAQIADRLMRLREAGVAQGEMALLLGTTSRVGLYLDALRSRGLDAVVTGGSSFSSTHEVGIVQALLHTLANPHDTETGLFRVLSSDLFRLDADDFCQLGSRTQERLDAPTKRAIERCFVEGELELYGGAKPSARLRRAHEVLTRAFGRLGTWQLADVCQAVIEESGWLARLEERGLDGIPVAANVLAAVRYVRELTLNLGLGPAQAADEFDRWLTASKLTPASLVGDEVDAVRVMTIHGSKGLQFPVTAVSECWGNPTVSGKLALGRMDGHCYVCARPTEESRTYTSLRATLEPPASVGQCTSVADWALLLDAREVAAEEAERARLLYVALTRAEEALVVGIPLAEKEQYRSRLAQGMLAAFPELDEIQAGVVAVDVAPSSAIECERRVPCEDGNVRTVRTPAEVAPGCARVVLLERQGRAASDPWFAESAGELPGFDGQLPAGKTLVPMHGAPHVDRVLSGGQRHFWLYDDTSVGESDTARSWRAREGVFSYSSAHALMEAARDAEQLDGGKEQDGPMGRVMPPPRKEVEAASEGAAYTDDRDKATSLGSAFHVLAQTMVETGRDHDPKRLEALARHHGISARQHVRLQDAIARWERSDIRAEARSHGLLRAEAPFFCRVDASYGDYVEGAIDLLCTDAGSTSALVVDYKTGDAGLSFEEIVARHEMQANFYATVLMRQGYERISCAFVCVELDDGRGQPVVARYEFDATHPPRI